MSPSLFFGIEDQTATKNRNAGVTNDMHNNTLVLFVRNFPLNVIKNRESINQRDGTPESTESMKQIKSVVPRAKLNTN